MICGVSDSEKLLHSCPVCDWPRRTSRWALSRILPGDGRWQWDLVGHRNSSCRANLFLRAPDRGLGRSSERSEAKNVKISVVRGDVLARTGGSPCDRHASEHSSTPSRRRSSLRASYHLVDKLLPGVTLGGSMRSSTKRSTANRQPEWYAKPGKTKIFQLEPLLCFETSRAAAAAASPIRRWIARTSLEARSRTCGEALINSGEK